ncbi:hypothetical protein [Prochlorococcus sp. MIT 1341]|uniref:hypothetical protein n=1 Tax=Prochlorococcus sp. MIT 1341 TaxID=3096221 RepID=UPI002A752E30|nr:hypothetical protein [Prochlorococcus sp. MIT 1341]
MIKYFIAIVSASILLILPLQPCFAETVFSQEEVNSINIELPSVLDDDFFEDLPFEQRRQALRDEVELDPKRSPSPQIPKKYNLLIR